MTFDVRVAKSWPALDLDIAFETGNGVTALFGPSGVGKTSVLNMIAGVLRPDRGRIVVGGCEIYDDSRRTNLLPEQRRAGYIFQDGRLFPHMTVRRNLRYGAKLAPPGASLLSESDAIGMLGIGALLDRRPSTLSGGEAQRVSIGRALLASPRFLLLDEPLTYLDDARKEEIFAILERVRDTLALPILYVTHVRSELERLAASVVTLTLDGRTVRASL
jgi:molybdate transport system ATP-binding protein